MLLLFCSRAEIFHWLQNHLVPCPFKYLTGIDCPGCGFQRAMLAFVQGDFSKSWGLYPPAVPLTLFFIYGIADHRLKLDTQNHIIKKTLYMLLSTLIIINYGIKIWALYHAHYRVTD